ncbi:Serine/threonine-protein phosphatase CPPED1 [Acipenser ruthenus]|uniref:Serine/threonine-protein phosphatase CPPED1 n=1 Tax=Acipenser ruthenus TaxID=7906 RepID=A0A662Z1L9_ACIRT|nr:Serine/threonine-protein phosphatase CPPED1 [Acipenser ruthenus]
MIETLQYLDAGIRRKRLKLSSCNDLKRSQISIFQAQIDSLPKRFQCEISLAVQQLKLLLGTLIKSSAQEGVKAVFSGHYHCNAGGMHNGPDMVVTSATGCQLGTDPHRLTVVVVIEVIHRYYSLDEQDRHGERAPRPTGIAFQH